MKLSTRSRYGVRALLDLALHQDDGKPVPLKEVAKRQNVSERYLENIMTTLASAGIVKGKKGRQGGFLLSKAPANIRVGDVIAVTEGGLSPVACVDDPDECDRSEICVTRDIWKKLKTSITETLNSVTLADMAEMHAGKPNTEEALMFYI